jgi:uncharacterized protein
VADLPPLKRWHTREDSGIRLDRRGRWWHDEEPIEHPRIIEAFNVGLAPTGDGRFKLTFGNDWCFVTVEDAAYQVLALDPTEDEQLSVRLSDRTAERLDVGSLSLDEEGVLSCRVKRGLAKARFSRDAQFQLGSLIELDGGLPFLRVGQQRIPLPPNALFARADG